VSLGTDANKSGWDAGPHDTTFGALGISGGDPIDTDTFKPVSDLNSIVPPFDNDDFPATDFNGKFRFSELHTTNAPGAVSAYDD